MAYNSFFLVACILTIIEVASVAAGLTLTEVLEEIPSCALECLLDYIPSSTCPTTNLTCVCTNIPLQSKLSACIQVSCNFTEQIRIAEINDGTCAGIPVEFRGWQVIIIGLVFGILTLMAVFLRCLSRYLIAKAFWWDDWAILSALALLMATVLVATFNCMLGYGKHFWNIEPTKIVALLKLFWCGEIVYNATLTMTRISILFFYLRVFQTPWFRRFTIASMVFAILAGLAFNFVILLQCKPISGAWDWTIPRSQCINLNAAAFANAGVGITQDLVILLMPIPNLLSLQMDYVKKLNIIFLFSLGMLAVITSIVRLRFMVAFGDSTDPTWDNIIPTTWSILEISIAMICTCLPSVRALFYRWFPSIFPGTAISNNSRYKGHTDRSWNGSHGLKLGPDTENYSSHIDTGQDKSATRANSNDDTLSPSDDIFGQTDDEIRNSRQKHGKPRRSDEVMFFHVSQDAIPLTKLDRNHIAKQVVVSVNSSTVIPQGRSEERMNARK